MSLSQLRKHYWLHVHLSDVPLCLWYMGDERAGKMLTSDLLFAEAVEFKNLREIADKIHAMFPTTALVEAHECTNACLTDEMKRIIRVV